MEPSCRSHYSMGVIEKTIETDEIERMRKYAAETETYKKSVKTPNFYKCPGCEYGKVINPTIGLTRVGKTICYHQTTVLECLNESCKRKTCIFCKENQHLPWSCIENRYWSPVRATAYIQKKADQAVLRNCPKCGRVFHNMVVGHSADTVPCNRGECECGHKMCYVCKIGLNDETNNIRETHFSEGASDGR